MIKAAKTCLLVKKKRERVKMIAPRQGQVSGRFSGALSMFWSSRREEAGEKTQAEGVRKERGLTAGNGSAQTSLSSETRISRGRVLNWERNGKPQSWISAKVLFVSLFVCFLFYFACFCSNESPNFRGIMHPKNGWEHGREVLREGRHRALLSDAYSKLLPERVRLV